MTAPDRKVAVVTGAGQGLGRSEALELARQGFAVVVNDIDQAAADAVVDEIVAAGGEACPMVGDCSDHDTAGSLIATAVETFGRLDAAVNNAGINRDRTMLKMSLDEWRTVTHVHLDSHFSVTQHACRHFVESGTPGRIVCTTSTAGLLGNFGQSNYGAAKAGIAAFATIVAEEMAKHGVTCNAIAPTARTRMTAALMVGGDAQTGDGFDFWSPDNVAPFVAFLCSAESGHISGKVFGVLGDAVELYRPFTSAAVIENGRRRWEPDSLADRVSELFDATGITPGPSHPMDARRYKMI